MLIFPAGAVLNGVAMTHARIGYQTWLRDLIASSITVSSEDEDSAKDAPLRPDTYEYWMPTELPATWEADFGQLRAVDYVGIAGHTIGSSGCTLLVETSADGSTYETFASDVAPTDDAPLMFLDDEVEHRFLRLTLTGADVMPKIAVSYAGVALAMQRRIYGGHAPITLSRQTVLHQNLSRGGQFLGQQIRRMGVSGSAEFRYLTAAWYRANFDPFVKEARRYPYFFAWRPETFPLEVGYVWSGDDITPSNMGTKDFMQVSMKMQGAGYE